jgi:signal transduction histidine kinase
MDLYAKKSRWKIYLGIVGVLIVAISMFYTNYLVKQLEEEETKKVKIWAEAYRYLNDPSADLNTDFSLNLAIIEANTSIPVILVNNGGGIDAAKNFGVEKDTSSIFLNSNELRQELASIKAEKREPIIVESFKIYYKHSKILVLLRYFPMVQMVLIGAFILFGYLGFSSARRSEQNQVWAGMAKETAHQLGTPISAILGWIDHLKMTHEGDEATHEVLNELDKDVDRLELIAERFSKIGSAPILEPVNLIEQLESCRVYMQKRSSRQMVFEFPPLTQAPVMANINAPLFDWVIENLLRNALDAMDGKGKITVRLYEEKNNICIDVSDTGKGIPSNKFKTVFEPGFTTKKRGWGLGLSLVKRIVNEYHKGKIFVAKSVINEGTTFTIKLPLH